MAAIIATILAFAPAYAQRRPGTRGIAPHLNVARANHSATALADGTVLVVGGLGDGALVAEAEIIDPASGRTSVAARSIAPRARHTATLLADGRVLITGGSDAAAALESTELYDAQSRSFQLGPRMQRARSGHSATLLPDGTVVIAGGDAEGTIELFDPKSDSFLLRATVSSVSRVNHSAIALQDGRVLMVGGTDANGNALETAALYDPATDRTTEIAPRTPRQSPRLRLLPDGKVQVIGGNGGAATMEMFNPRGYFTAEVRIATAATANSRIDAAAGSSVLGGLPVGCHGCAIAETNDRRTVIAGGVDPSGRTSAKIEVLSSAAAEPWVTTDKTDYSPGEFVFAKGGGYAAGEEIVLSFTRDPQMSTERVTRFTVTADDEGNFTNAGKEFPIVEEDLGTSFLLVAEGVTSKRTAFTSFTDGNIKVAVTGVANFTFSYTHHKSSASCGAGASDVSGSGTAGTTLGVGSSESATFSTNDPGFLRWRFDGTVVGTNRTVCIGGFQQGSKDLIAEFAATAATTLTVANASGTYAGTTTLTATLTSGSAGVSGRTIAFSLNGASVGTATTNGSGVATLTGVSLSGINAGTYATAVGATFAGDASYSASSGTASLTVAKAASTTTVTCGAGPFTYTGSAQTPCTATVTGAGGLNQSLTVSYSNNVNAGTATASASYAGGTNHTGSSDSKNFTIAKAASTTTVTCGAGPFTYTGSAHTPCTATVTGAGGLNQSLTVSYSNNVNAGSATASATYAGGDNHTGSSDSKNFTIAKAATTTTVTCGAGPFTYNGSAQTPCTATVTGAGGLNQSLTVSYSNNVNAGSATASATYAGGDNHTGSSDAKNFTIDKAASTTTITCGAGPFTYSGAAQTPCSAAVTGPGGLNQPVSIDYSNNVNAGSATASATYAGGDNHTGSSDSKNFTIDKAASTTTITCAAGPFTYNAAAQTPCSARATGAGGLDEPLTPSYSNNTSAGTATVSASFAGSDNHAPSSDSSSFLIGKASSLVTVTCGSGSFAYDGTAHTPCAASVTGAGMSPTALTVVYSDNVNAGTATASASWSGDDNHTGNSDSATFVIGKAASTVTVTCGGSVTYTGAAQTPCSATVAGVGGLSEPLTVSYSNNVSAGTATASAAYAGGANHAPSSGSNTFAIGKAASSTVVMCDPTSVTYNGAAQTPCSATVTGAGGLSQAVTVSYSHNMNVGEATASAAYAGDSNYDGSSDSKNFAITRASSSTVVTCPASVTYNGSAQTPCTAIVTGAGGLNETVSVSHSDNVNAGTATAGAAYSGPNHTSSSDTKQFAIGKAASTTVVTCGAGPFTYNGSAHRPCSAAVTGAGGLSETLTVGYTNNTNAGTAGASAAYAESANHTGSSHSASFTINKAQVGVGVAATHTQYSDSATITYTVVPVNAALASEATGSVVLKIGTRTVATIPVNGGVAGATSVVIVTEMPGAHDVSATFTSSNSNLANGGHTSTFNVTPEDATVKYTGPTSAWVNSNDQAPITLTAMVYDPGDGTPGDVRNSRVTFVNRGTGGPLGTCKDVRVDLVDPANTTYGTATCNWTATLQKSDNAESFTVGLHVLVGYSRNASADDVIITVARNVQSQIIGMGTSIAAATAPVSRFGAVTGGVTFAFDVTYNKSLTNLQGDGQISFTAGGRTYRAKTNSLVSLIAKAGSVVGDGTATLTAKASITDVTDPLNPLSVEGNATIEFDVTGSGPGAPGDKAALTVWGRDGGVVYSNYFIPATGRTAQQAISAGNISVR